MNLVINDKDCFAPLFMRGIEVHVKDCFAPPEAGLAMTLQKRIL
jgi:hypothetical protein